MKIIKIGPHTLSVGLDWVVSQAATADEAIAEAQAQEPEKKFGVVVTGPDTYAVGVASKTEKSIVGAAWLAESQKNDGDFILIEPLSSGEYWLCAIKNGTPFYGSDVVGTADKIEIEAKTLLTAGSFRLITSDQGFAESLSELASTFTEAAFDATVKGSGSAFKLKEIGGSKKKILMAMLVVMGLGAVYFGWDMYTEHENQQKALQMVKQKQAAAKAQEEQLRAAAKAEFEALKIKVLQEQEKKINDILSESGAQVASVLWTKIVTVMPTNTAGWSYSMAICDKAGCSFLLKPENGARNKDLFKIFPSASLSEKGEAEVKMPVAWPKENASIAELKTRADFLVSGISELQDIQGYGFPVKWTPAVDLTVDVPLPSILQGVPSMPGAEQLATAVAKASETIQLGIAKGTFKIEGHSLWALEGLSKALTSKGIVYEKVEMSFDDQIGTLKNWTLEGSYYAKP